MIFFDRLNNKIFFNKLSLENSYLSRVKSALNEGDFKKVELTVDSKNKAAVCLYKEFGFERINLRKDEYGRGIDRELMRLEL